MDWCERVIGSYRNPTRIFSLLVIGLFWGSAGWSAYRYFVLVADHPRVQAFTYPEETAAGRMIASSTPGSHFILDSRFYESYVTGFLAYDRWKDARRLDQPDSWNFTGGPVLFCLNGEKKVLADWILKLHPAASQRIQRDAWGAISERFLNMDLPPGKRGTEILPRDHGLWAGYWPNPNQEGKPALVRWELSFSFDFFYDSPQEVRPEYSARWEGKLDIPQTGKYEFMFVSGDHCRMWLGAQKVVDGIRLPQGSVRLRKGRHPIRMDFLKTTGQEPVLDLVWKVPGAKDWSPVPLDRILNSGGFRSAAPTHPSPETTKH